jgi:hypothetical protein
LASSLAAKESHFNRKRIRLHGKFGRVVHDLPLDGNGGQRFRGPLASFGSDEHRITTRQNS